VAAAIRKAIDEGGDRDTMEILVRTLIEEFKRDNSRFDPARFREAALG
jgi:hypothetical protein